MPYNTHRLLVLFLLLCNSTVAFAQKTDKTQWHLTIIDSITAKGIDKVTISINKTYYMTVITGSVDINKNAIAPKDKIRISCVGYRPRIIIATTNNYPDTIKLETAIISLDEVKISPAGSTGITEGDIKKKYNVHRITSLYNSYAQFIPNDKKIKGTITSVEYVVNDELHGIEMPFRVRLFTKMKDSLTLDKELTMDSIIVYNPQKKKRLSVDVSQYNIRLPQEGIIAIFELLDSSYYSKDEILYNGNHYIKTPGIDMEQNKNYWGVDYTKADRRTPYAMVGPSADTWNLNDVYTQWYVYADGNNFAITITIDPDR